MPRAEAGSAKAIGNAIKARGLTKLRFYCQVCEKACRDENGYKMHIQSESHMRQIAALGSNAGKVIDDFSKRFQDEFVSLLSRRFGTARINANRVYQEYIAERHHLHMNATKWVTLSEFVKHLGREGICHVEEIQDEGQFGWYVSWIDNSPAALARQDALQKMERAKMDEEGRMRKYLREQIERAKEHEGQRESPAKVEEGLQRNEARAPLKIGISLSSSKQGRADADDKTVDSMAGRNKETEAPHSSNASSSSIPSAPTKFGINALKSKPATSSAPTQAKHNPLKAPATNPLRATSSSTTLKSAPVSASSSRTSAMTAAERIMAEEQERKRKMSGPSPAANVKRSRF